MLLVGTLITDSFLVAVIDLDGTLYNEMTLLGVIRISKDCFDKQCTSETLSEITIVMKKIGGINSRSFLVSVINNA